MTRKRTAASYPEFHEQALFAKRLLLDPRTKHLPWTSTLTGANLTVIQAALAKRKGVRRGVPDWMLYQRRGLFAGLAIELKRPDGEGRFSLDQVWWQNALFLNLWRVVTVLNATEAWSAVMAYLGYEEET